MTFTVRLSPGPNNSRCVHTHVSPDLRGDIAQAIRDEVTVAISRARRVTNHVRLLVAAANRIANAWGYATVEGFAGSSLVIHIEPGNLRIGGRKWDRVVRRERNRRLGNRALPLLDSPEVRVRNDATVMVARMGEKVRGAQ